MEYLDFDLEIGLGTGRNYPISVRSPTGQVQGSMRFPYDTLELEIALLRLKNALLGSGGSRRRVLTESEAAVQTFGQRLFEALLADDARSLYYESKREAARLGKDGLRLRLHIRPPELAGLPWEYLYDPRVPNYLCLSNETPLVRYVELAHPVEPLSVAPPLRILVMTASPSDLDQLQIEREQERMRRALGPLEAQGLVSLTWLPGQTARDLQRALQRGPWHIFHFIGHGDYDPRSEEGVLALANEQGKTALLYATQVANLLTNHKPLRLAILNACNGAKGSQTDIFSSTAATMARRGLPAVVAMQEEITDAAATEWTHAFYEALATGLPVDAAVAEARLAITLTVNNSLEWGTPVLFLRALDGVLFHLSEAARPPEPAGAAANVTPAPTAATSEPASQPLKQEAAPEQPSEPAESAVESLPRLAPTAPASQKTKEQWVEEGHAHWNAQRIEEALAAYESALELDPMDAVVWTHKGWMLFTLQRYAEALAACDRALEVDPNFGTAWNYKGVVLGRLERYTERQTAYEEEVAAYERTLKLDPKNALAWYGKGSVLLILSRHQEALAAFERAVEVDPKNALAWGGKGNALSNLHRYEEALAAHERAVEVDPKNPFVWLYKGHTLYELKRYEEALAAYERLLELNPQLDAGASGKIRTLERLGRSAEAEQIRQKARKLGSSG